MTLNLSKELIMIYPYLPIEDIDFPGFYLIPGYRQYIISKNGDVFNKETSLMLSGSRNPAGYVNYRLTDNNGKVHTWGRHRLMGFVFKYPGILFVNLVVNHKNGIKGDDWLDNLEWVTNVENIEHAGSLGLTTKCTPISVRDIDTGVVEKFTSIISCARSMGVSKDFINYRTKLGEDRIFPERKQYRSSHSDDPWPIPIDIDIDLMRNGNSKQILMRKLLTDEIIKFEKTKDLANYIGVSQSLITRWMSIPNQPTLPNFIQLKWAYDKSPWRHVDDPYSDLIKFSNSVAVKVTNSKTGDVIIYQSAVECAKAHSLLPTTLNWRLKSKSNKFYSDGYSYEYHSD